jgi:hypothetical protein
LVAFFASGNIQIKNIAKDSGVIYAEATRFDYTLADCGTPGLFQVSGRRVNFNVFVNRSSSTVAVNTDFMEVRRLENNVQTVTCNSRGILEGKLLNAVSQSPVRKQIVDTPITSVPPPAAPTYVENPRTNPDANIQAVPTKIAAPPTQPSSSPRTKSRPALQCDSGICDLKSR